MVFSTENTLTVVSVFSSSGLLLFEYEKTLAVWFAWDICILLKRFEFAVGTSHEPGDPVVTLCTKHSCHTGEVSRRRLACVYLYSCES